MDVVNTAADGILLDDSDTHDEWFGGFESGKKDVSGRVVWRRITAVPV
jgi:hypothetical protein